MNREHLHQIAPPRNRFSAGAEFHSRHLNDRPVRHVLAGNPFRVIQSQRTGLHRNLHMGVQNFLRSLARIHRQPNRPRHGFRPHASRSHKAASANTITAAIPLYAQSCIPFLSVA